MRVSSNFAYFFKPPCQQLLKSGWQPSIHAGFKDFSIFFKIFCQQLCKNGWQVSIYAGFGRFCRYFQVVFANSYAKMAGKSVFMRVCAI